MKAGNLGLVGAGELLELSYREAKRIWARYQAGGTKGLQHGSCGRRSKRLNAQIYKFPRSRRWQPIKGFAKNTSPSSDRVTLAGIVVGYNSGGRVRRDLIGAFGGVITLTVRFVFRDARTVDEIFCSELTSTGGPVFLVEVPRRCAAGRCCIWLIPSSKQQLTSVYGRDEIS